MLDETLLLPAPAKLNLFLHILGRRDDGYHQLQTLFQLLDFGDELTLRANTSSVITIAPTIASLAEQDNLIFKAAHLLKQHCPHRPELGANIQLHKRLPMGGGIGGGSSDAATTLIGLNYLWQTRLNTDQLADIGRILGADVPVFVRGQTAWAEGIGEQLTALAMPTKTYLVLSPECHVSTAEIFSHKDLTRGTDAIKVAAFLERGGKNDCQTLVESLFPQVRDAVKWLNQFGSAQMTGTGACVFAAFDSQSEAEQIFAKRPKHLSGFIANGINFSPLRHYLP